MSTQMKDEQQQGVQDLHAPEQGVSNADAPEADTLQDSQGPQTAGTPSGTAGADLSASEAEGEAVEAGDAEGDSEGEGEQETFPRAYVDKLRKEAAGHRERAKRADEFAAALWEARVAASGRLADATDLPMPEGADPLDAEAVEAAVEDLLARKPHLATRRPSGNIGQGVGSAPQNVSLAGMLRANV